MKLNIRKSGDKSTLPVMKGGVGHQIATDPFLDWVIILVVGLVIAAALVGVGVYVYFETQRTLVAADATAATKPALPFDRALLDKVLHEYGTRSAERSAIIKSFNAPKDLSL